MKTQLIAIVLLTVTVAFPTWAGQPAAPVAPAAPSAPAMNEGGLVMLALALGGAGCMLLGGNKR